VCSLIHCGESDAFVQLGGGTLRCSDGDPRDSAEFRGVPHILNIPMGSENSDGFQNVPLHSDQFLWVPTDSGVFQTVPNDSDMFRGVLSIPMGSVSIPRGSEHSEGFREHSDGS
jgi:hypothetical protein